MHNYSTLTYYNTIYLFRITHNFEFTKQLRVQLVRIVKKIYIFKMNYSRIYPKRYTQYLKTYKKITERVFTAVFKEVVSYWQVFNGLKPSKKVVPIRVKICVYYIIGVRRLHLQVT